MSDTTGQTIGEAVFENRSLTLKGLPDRIFARLFRGLVYPQIWEDPVCDRTALELEEGDDIVCIASGGCNVLSCLVAEPRSIAAVDLSPWHVQLVSLKLAAAQFLPEHRAFYAVFGHADEAGNIDLLDRFDLRRMPREAREFWNGREGFRARKTLFARGFYRFGVLGRFLGAVHLVSRIGGVN